MPAEVLIPPESVRQLAWRPPDVITDDSISDLLACHGARAWQIALVAIPLEAALLAEPEESKPQEVAESDSVEGS